MRYVSCVLKSYVVFVSKYFDSTATIAKIYDNVRTIPVRNIVAFTLLSSFFQLCCCRFCFLFSLFACHIEFLRLSIVTDIKYIFPFRYCAYIHCVHMLLKWSIETIIFYSQFLPLFFEQSDISFQTAVSMKIAILWHKIVFVLLEIGKEKHHAKIIELNIE